MPLAGVAARVHPEQQSRGGAERRGDCGDGPVVLRSLSAGAVTSAMTFAPANPAVLSNIVFVGCVCECVLRARVCVVSRQAFRLIC